MLSRMELSTEINPVEAAELLAETSPAECLLLDCRTQEEYSTACIKRAVLIPMQELPKRLTEIEAWQKKRLIVHCHHGVRSLRVTNWLRERGFSSAQSIQGGIDAWSTAVDPAIPRY